MDQERKGANRMKDVGMDLRTALQQLGKAGMRKLLSKRLHRNELSVLWFDIFESPMDDHLVSSEIDTCVIAFIDRVEQRGLKSRMIDWLCENRPDLNTNRPQTAQTNPLQRSKRRTSRQHNTSQKTTGTLKINATFSEYDSAKIAQLLELVRGLSGDMTIEFHSVSEGSVIIKMSGTSAGMQKLRYLIAEGFLDEVVGAETSLILDRESRGKQVPQQDESKDKTVNKKSRTHNYKDVIKALETVITQRTGVRNNVYILNIPQESLIDIRETFKSAGTILNVIYPHSYTLDMTSASLEPSVEPSVAKLQNHILRAAKIGIVIIQMSSQEEANQAVQLFDGYVLHGRKLIVSRGDSDGGSGLGETGDGGNDGGGGRSLNRTRKRR